MLPLINPYSRIMGPTLRVLLRCLTQSMLNIFSLNATNKPGLNHFLFEGLSQSCFDTVQDDIFLKLSRWKSICFTENLQPELEQWKLLFVRFYETCTVDLHLAEVSAFRLLQSSSNNKIFHEFSIPTINSGKPWPLSSNYEHINKTNRPRFYLTN